MKSLKELRELKEKARENLKMRQSGHEDTIRIQIGMSTCGIAAGARETLLAMMDEIGQRKLDNILVTQVGCMGNCYDEPIVRIQKPGQSEVLYGKVNAQKGKEIIDRYILKGEMLDELTLPKSH